MVWHTKGEAQNILQQLPLPLNPRFDGKVPRIVHSHLQLDAPQRPILTTSFVSTQNLLTAHMCRDVGVFNLVEYFKALTVLEPGKMELRDYKKPELKSKAWLMKIEMAGICGTDHHIINNKKPFPWAENIYPFIPGHEFVGRIEEVGSDFVGVDVEGFPLKKGDLVVVCPDGSRLGETVDSAPCGKCYYCMTGFPLFCANRTSKTNHGPVMEGWQRGFAEYRYNHGVEAIYKLPEDMPPQVGVLVEPLSIAIHAFERAMGTGSSWLYQGMGPGKVVVVIGSGPIGILSVIVAKQLGAWRIIVTGAPDNRLTLSKEFGAETISIEKMKTPEERIKAVKELTPYHQGADVVIEAAGTPSAFVEALDMVRNRGTIVEVGHFTDRGPAPINPFWFCAKNINIFGIFGGGPAGFLWAKRFLEKTWRQIPFEKLVTHKFPLKDFNLALETSRKLESMKTVMIP